jgi:membrane protein DedA with SNARE-associated domain
MESIVNYLSGVDALSVYLGVFFIAYIENVFPPFPSDVVVVFAGSLVAVGQGNAILTIAIASLGSTLGFLSMYWVGAQIGTRVLETGRLKFISTELVVRVEAWFRRYGYGVVVANRFLAGTRAVVSFCAGMSEMKLLPTVLLSALSALIWNTILVLLGKSLGDNWRTIGDYLALYGRIVSIGLGVAIVVWLVVMYVRSRKSRRPSV